MRITRDNIEFLNTALEDIEEVISDLRDVSETWLDEDTDREDRADARTDMEQHLESLEGGVIDILHLLKPNVVVGLR